MTTRTDQEKQQFLENHGASPSLCDAGLFHSVYGTESFKGTLIPLTLRPKVQTLIGSEAERLAWLFGCLQKESLYANLPSSDNPTLQHRQTNEELQITHQEFRDLCELTVANWLEQRPTAPEKYKFIRSESFFLMRPFLSEPGTVSGS